MCVKSGQNKIRGAHVESSALLYNVQKQPRIQNEVRLEPVSTKMTSTPNMCDVSGTSSWQPRLTCEAAMTCLTCLDRHKPIQMKQQESGATSGIGMPKSRCADCVVSVSVSRQFAQKPRRPQLLRLVWQRGALLLRP